MRFVIKQEMLMASIKESPRSLEQAFSAEETNKFINLCNYRMLNSSNTQKIKSGRNCLEY